MFTDCEACGGAGELPVDFGDYFPVVVGCRHCGGTGLGEWVNGDQGDDGDTRHHAART